ncbi:MAG: DUF4124 domain-containing protein [Pseudomonadota bacterium]|nr:DUF4124 domain-containing protein [Pseudomonadota bacterium]
MRLSMQLGSMLVAMLLSWTAQADVYRWVDDKGRVHFSDQAPVGGNAQALDLPEVKEEPGTPDLSEFERMQRQQKLVKMLEEERLAKEEQRAKLAQEAEERAKYCTRFRNRLSYLDQYTHFYDEKEDGTREYMSEDEADAYRSGLKQKFRDECGEA